MNYEMAELRKKLIVVACTTLICTVLISMAGDVSFLSALGIGFCVGLTFYFPGRLKQYFHIGLIGTIGVVIGFWMLCVFLISISEVLGFLFLLLPLADIGVSIYRVVKQRQSNNFESADF